jgi:hypothetical protein
MTSPRKPLKVRTSFTLDPETVGRARKEAKLRNRSLSNFIEQIIERRLREIERDRKRNHC